MAAPSLFHFERSEIFSLRSGDYLHQCAHPLTRALGTPIMAYRIFVPTVAWLIGARLWLALALPYFASVAMLAVVCHAMSVRHGRKIGMIATMLVATSYAVTWPDCMLGYPDSVAHLLAASLLLVRRPSLVALIVAAGLLTDERFVLELPLVVLWHYSTGGPRGGGHWLDSAWRPIALALGAWLVFRHALTVGWIGPGIDPLKTYGDIPNTLRTLRPLGMSWACWWGNAFESFRWSWIVILAAMACRWRAGRRREALFLGVVLGASALSTVVVFDVARSLGFSYLAIPLALVWLLETSRGSAERFGSWAAWLCYLTPTFWIVPGYLIWWRPLPLRVFSFLTGVDPLSWQPWVR